MLEIQVLTWDRHKNMAALSGVKPVNRIPIPPPSIVGFPTTIQILMNDKKKPAHVHAYYCYLDSQTSISFFWVIFFIPANRKHASVFPILSRNCSTSSQQDYETEDTEYDTKQKVLRASLPFVHQHGWTSKALVAGTLFEFYCLWRGTRDNCKAQILTQNLRFICDKHYNAITFVWYIYRNVFLLNNDNGLSSIWLTHLKT